MQPFGELLKAENILKNFDEFGDLRNWYQIGEMQDMKSVYVDIRESVWCPQRKEDGDDDLIDFFWILSSLAKNGRN